VVFKLAYFTSLRDNVTIAGLTFDGGGVFVDNGVNDMNQNITVAYNVFNIHTSGNRKFGFQFTSGLRHSRITNNRFTTPDRLLSEFGIMGYSAHCYDDLTIANNEFFNLVGGIHVDAQEGTQSTGLLVEQNYLSGIGHQGMEFQGGVDNATFQDNFYENPVLDPIYRVNMNAYGFSLPLDRSTNVVIRRNTVIAPQRPDGKGSRIAFEVGGGTNSANGTLVQDNYINGINAPINNNDFSDNGSYVTAQGNRIISGLELVHVDVDKQSNNGPDTVLTWDIYRRPPGTGSRY